MIEELSVEELDRRLIRLVKRENEALSDLIEHLAQFEKKEGAEKLAYPTLFDYCTKRLGYSEGAAYKRIRAARAVRKSPLILTALRDRRVHLTAVAMINPFLTAENADDLLKRASGKGSRSLELLVEELKGALKPEELQLSAPSAASSPEGGGDRPGPVASRLRVVFERPVRL